MIAYTKQQKGVVLMLQEQTGPLLDDVSFFHDCLNLDYEGMEDVKKAVETQNYEMAKKAMAEYIRKTLEPERLLSIPYEEPENVYKYPDESDAEACNRVKDHVMISVGVPCDYGKNQKIDWRANPTYNQYKEWTWQLNRHHELKMLAHEYNRTKNMKWAKLAAELFESWVKQAVYPGDVIGYATDCWRTIECGIRMGANWPYVLFTFFNTEPFTDDVLIHWYKSVWEHGHRLFHHSTQGNWLIMEMNGLAQIGILYPQFQQSSLWLETAFTRLSQELDRQIYPDGFQYELSTGYHDVVINNYQRLFEVAKAFDIPIPNEMLDKLALACEIDVKLMMPNGRLPDINDGKNEKSRDLLLPKSRMLPNNQKIRYIITAGQEGEAPDYCSINLPYSGFAVMRNGWKKDSIWALFDGAPFGRAHQHEDKLSLLVYAGGRLLITEGGNYAYDDSEMRKYVLSSRSHNTVRVDGMGQNRRKDYTWKDEDIKKKSDMAWKAGEEFDYAKSTYAEGYGPNAVRGVLHNRSVYFVKKPENGLQPFFLVVDRMFSDISHEYEVMWHVDSEEAVLSESGVDTKDINVCISGENRSLSVISGQESPEWQGFVATGTEQGMYRPVNCVSAIAKGKNLRIVTALYPHLDKERRIICVKAEEDPTSQQISVALEDGSWVTYNEQDMRGNE